jgi:uracil-DNA glycosylase
MTRYKFGHGNVHRIQNFILVDSFHPSPLNTQTGRLSATDFDRVLREALKIATSNN